MRRAPTEFNLKLTHFYIRSQVSISLEISKPGFMKLVHEGMLLIYKDEVKAAQYINKYQSFLAQAEIEELRKLMEKCHIEIDKRSVPCDGTVIVHRYEAEQHDPMSQFVLVCTPYFVSKVKQCILCKELDIHIS